MVKERESLPDETELTSQPFYYEIRVSGTLSKEQWTSWFDNLAVINEQGETVLRGVLTDRAALYGLLGRFRDLAVPLVSVNVLDAQAQRRLQEQSKRYDFVVNLLLVLVYLLLLAGLVTVTVLIAPVIHVALALAMLFAALGGLAYSFALWSGKKAWRYVSYLIWPVAVVTLSLYLATSSLLPAPLGIAAMFLLMAGGLIYLVYFFRGRSDEIKRMLGGWSVLGSVSDSDEAGTEGKAADPNETD